MQVSILRWGDSENGPEKAGLPGCAVPLWYLLGPQPLLPPTACAETQEPRASFGTGGVWAGVAGGGL